MYFIVVGGESVPTNKTGRSDGVALTCQRETLNPTPCLFAIYFHLPNTGTAISFAKYWNGHFSTWTVQKTAAVRLYRMLANGFHSDVVWLEHPHVWYEKKANHKDVTLQGIP